MIDQLKNFKKSLRVLQKTHPPLAHQLALIDPSSLEFCWTQDEELNLKRLHEGQIHYYHSPISAKKEAQEWFHSLDLHLATVIFVYGLGLGYYYEAARGWLKQHPHHALIFLEDDLTVLFRLCETELGWQLLSDPQVQLVFLRDAHSDQSIFNELAWAYFETAYLFSSLSLYKEIKGERFFELPHKIQFHFQYKEEFIEEYVNLGVAFFRNFYLNLFELPHAYWGNGLFNRFLNVPAIICGEGPSLQKNIHLLAELKERALLFAGGATLHNLISMNIIPQFGVAIDASIEQYSQVVIAEPHAIPFFYRNRVFHEALKSLPGPHLYLNGEGRYPTADWFEQQLGIEGEKLEDGLHFIHFSLAIARALGCNPIILIGADFAFPELDEEPEKNQIDLEEFLPLVSKPSLILKENIYGKPVYTIWKWIQEAEWISNFAKRYPELTLVNATEGGLDIKGIPNSSLREVMDKFLQDRHEAIETIKEEIQQHSFQHITQDKVIVLLEEMKGSLNSSILLFSKMLEDIDALAAQIEQGHPFPADLRPPDMALLESKIEEEIAYSYLLGVFSQIFIHLHHRTVQDLQSSKRRQSERKRALNKLELDKQRIIFLRDVARFNRELIQRTLEDRRSASE